MNAEALRALLPLLVLAATPLAVMIAIALRRHHGTAAALSASGQAAALAAAWRGLEAAAGAGEQGIDESLFAQYPAIDGPGYVVKF